ncbi:MAG: hypothetical protein NXI30_18875 [bacterium]|nr:hypothetical protein [bacterium]
MANRESTNTTIEDKTSDTTGVPAAAMRSAVWEDDEAWNVSAGLMEDGHYQAAWDVAHGLVRRNPGFLPAYLIIVRYFVEADNCDFADHARIAHNIHATLRSAMTHIDDGVETVVLMENGVPGRTLNVRDELIALAKQYGVLSPT